jgi:hypothetical protein
MRLWRFITISDQMTCYAHQSPLTRLKHPTQTPRAV